MVTAALIEFSSAEHDPYLSPLFSPIFPLFHQEQLNQRKSKDVKIVFKQWLDEKKYLQKWLNKKQA